MYYTNTQAVSHNAIGNIYSTLLAIVSHYHSRSSRVAQWQYVNL